MTKIIYEIGNGEIITFKTPNKCLIFEDYLDIDKTNKNIDILEK